MSPRRLILLAAFALGGLFAAAPASAAPLTPEQITLAQALDGAAAGEAVALAAKAAAWKKELDAPEATVDQQAARAWQIGEEITAAVEKTSALYHLIQYAQVAPHVTTGRTQWRTARYSATEYAGFTAANFREEARRRAERAAGEQLLAVFRSAVFPALADLAEPAAYVHRFATGKLRQWTEKPLAAPDNSLTFQIVPLPAGTPPLADETRLEIDVVYLPGDLTIRAQGLRFRYAADEPQAVLDGLAVTGDLPQTVVNNVKRLGEALQGTRDAPLQLTLRGKPDFGKVIDGRRGPLSADVAVRVFPGSTLAAVGTEIVLFPGNVVDWQKRPLTISTSADEPPVRIGRSALGLWSLAGELDPTTAKLTAKGALGAFGKRPESFVVDCSLTGSTPVAALDYEAAAMVDARRWFTASGKLDFAADRVTGAIHEAAAAEPIAGLAVAGGAMSFDRGRLLVDGPLQVFGQLVPQMHCEVDLVDGSGRFYADGPCALADADIAHSLDGRIDAGFKSTRLAAAQSLNVSGIKDFGDVWIAAALTADAARKPPVELSLYAFDPQRPAKIAVDDLAAVTKERIAAAVAEQAAAANKNQQDKMVAAKLGPLPTDAAAQDRVARLQKLARSIESLMLDLALQSEDRRQAGRRSSRTSAWHLKTSAPAVVGLSGDAASHDAALVFPFQTSGFLCEILPPDAEPVVQAAADVQVARLAFADFVGDKPPRVRIELPKFEHASAPAAPRLLQDALQARVEQFFPEAAIEGSSRRFEKQLVIRNDTTERLLVWVVPHSRAPQGGALAWDWRPVARFEVEPQATLPLVADDGRPLLADTVRLWAESASGNRWDDHRYDELRLVTSNANQTGRPFYHAEQPETFVHAIGPPTEPLLFAQRVVEFRNESTERLHVKLDYQTTDVGRSAPASVEFDLEPDQTLRPRDAEGRQIHASRIRFSAEAENRKFHHNATEPVWLVDEVNGRRAYAATSVGAYRHVFLPHEGAPAVATVNAAKATVMSGRDVVANVRRGDKFDVLDRNEGWVLVAVASAGERKTGWIEKQHVVVENGGPPAPPNPAIRTIRITAATANVQIGNDVIGQVVKDKKFRVLQRREGWSRIEFTVDGEARQGWIDDRKTAAE